MVNSAVKAVRLLWGLSLLHLLKSEPCDLQETHASVIILDITESIGDDYGQSTYPKELPIVGNSSSIRLKISDANPLFRIEGKSLHLTKALDRDKDELSTIRFELNCHNILSNHVRSIPIILRIEDQNDNTPVFVGDPYTIVLPEDTPVGSAIFKDIKAVDTDASVNGQVIYEIINVTLENIFDIRFPHQGVLYLNAPLDHERVTSYELTILATDLALHPSDRLNSTAKLTIQVQDIDDQDPVFDTAAVVQPCPIEVSPCNEAFEYHSSIVEGELNGVLDIYPTRIHAVDPDSLGSIIVYSFGPGTPSFTDYFEMDPRTAVIRQVKAVHRSEIKHFQIVIEATEISELRRKTSAVLLITVKGVDTSPPKLVAPSLSGIVQEGSPSGTKVLRDDGSGEPFTLYVTDPDHRSGDSLPKYIFELTTNDFEVTNDGTIIVSNPNLDRDPPNRPVLAFQAIAREVEKGVASAPVALTIALRDVNDNAPRISVYPTISIAAGNERRILQKIHAEDIDEGDNAKVRFFLTKDAEGRFSIDTQTGDIVSEANLNSGEQFQLEIQVTDSGGLSGRGILDIIVSRGPNTNGPIFTKSRYTAAIPEDTPFGATILTVEATDPEADTPYYSIVSGIGMEIFEIDTLSGILSVVAPLDREKTEQYEMVVQAEDSEGVSNSAAVTIRILDVNDEAPQFVDLPYSFRVDEGSGEAFVGVVKAHDTDLNVAGMVSYNLLSDNSIFKIDPLTGEIFTSKALDYEKEQAHYIPVVAVDKAVDSLSSTATVTVLVNDLSDEVPIFTESSINVNVKENSPIGTLVASVRAEDKDTQKSVTYVMKSDSRLFKVHSQTGRITSVGSLDYEENSHHYLVIGTEENSGLEDYDRIGVNISVVDLNDFTPRLSKYQTITIPQNAPVGSLLLTAVAADGDGTAPNNKISYSMNGLPATDYFEIDEKSGEIKLKRSMKSINTTEILVTLTAADGGNPSLEDSTEFVVVLLKGGSGISDNSIDSSNGQLGKYILASFPRFLKDKMEKMVREDQAVKVAILKVPLVNASTSISCSILEGDYDGYFGVYVSQDRNCVLQLIKPLDYESNKSFQLKLVLHPSSVSLSAVKQDELLILSESLIIVNVENLNDNVPAFSVPESNKPSGLEENNVLSFVLETADLNTPVFTLTATDADEDVDRITYVLDPQTNRGNYFSFDERRNLILTRRRLANVPANLLPFNLTLIATDQPDTDGTVHSKQINVIVPVIEDEHRSVLVIRSPKEYVEAKKSSILEVLSQTSGSFASHEMTKQHRRNDGELITNFYFHLLSPSLMPRTHEILQPSETNEMTQKIMEIDGINSALLISRNQLNAKTSEEILQKQEEAVQNEREIGKEKTATAVIFGPAVYVFLAMAAAIIIFVIVASFITCLLWRRFHSKWTSADKRLMLIPPLLERPPSTMDGFSKEYEVQVLHMSIPLDEDSTPELPSSSSHQYFLDNVSYISKAQTGNDGTSSEESHSGRTSPRMPYDMDSSRFPQMHSSTNENVMFVRKPMTDRSPVETTTEL